jgi:hypothetical protein
MPRLSVLARSFLASASLVATLSLAPGATSAQPIKIGLLTCHVAPGVGKIIFSNRDLSCRFSPDDGRPENYVGSVDRLGVDLGFTNEGVLVWAVLAVTGEPSHGALAGTYLGGGATATVVVGVGANALLGGFDRSLVLQPVSFQAQTGLDVNAGLTSLTLRHSSAAVSARY